VRRAEIPDGLLKARRADIDRIPGRVLAKMTRGDLSNRLVAAGEYRRRASVPHLDGDLLRYRLGLASEVLTTDDQNRAAELVKGAGVAAAGHGPFVGTHTHAHPAFGSQGGDVNHEHEHSHDGDASHSHTHTAKSARSTRPAAPGTLRKAAQPAESAGSVYVHTPTLDILADSKSCGDGITKLLRQGALGHLRQDIAAVEKAAAKLGTGGGKAAEYERKAYIVTDPETRRGYLELAAQERQKAGAA
jgi:hypothetical protein